MKLGKKKPVRKTPVRTRIAALIEDIQVFAAEYENNSTNDYHYEILRVRDELRKIKRIA